MSNFPTPLEWSLLHTAQDVSQGLDKSKDLRSPRDPQYALKALEARVSEIASKRSMTKGRVS